MDTLVLIVAVVVIALLLIIIMLLLKAPSQQPLDRMGDRMESKLEQLASRNLDFERNNTQTLLQFQTNLTNALQKQSELIDRKLNLMDTKMSESLQDGFQKTNATFVSIAERLQKIDEAQKKIDSLSTNIVSLQDILTDKKARGAFGEVQLNQILSSIFGESNPNIYQIQYSFSNRSRVDAVLFAPEPLGTIGIDSKFPLENYRSSIDTSLDHTARKEASKLFVSDCRKHIDDIASKYIIPNETSDQAIMFIPAEAVFAHIHAYFPEVIEYAQKKRVWITSPTTLMSTLTTIQVILKNMEREKYAAVIHQHLKDLSVEFDRYKVRWSDLVRKIDSVGDEVKKINTTSDKISKRFESIANVDQDTIA